MASSPRRELVLYEAIASGGMATVHLAKRTDPSGAETIVAVKRLREDAGSDAEVVTMLFDEARCAARVRHPNVVSTLDALADPSGLMLVLEYVHGDTLAHLMRDCGGPLPPGIAASIVVGALHGLHAAHEATDENGNPLRLVHRDVSPQNIMVGTDGVARVLDFGVAKAVGRLRTTRDGSVRGKLGYLAPEQLLGRVTPRSDVFSAAVVLWEALTGRRLYVITDPNRFLEVSRLPQPAPSELVGGLSPALDRIVMRGLSPNPEERYPTARAMADELASRVALAPLSEVGAFVTAHAGAMLARRSELLTSIADGRARPSRANGSAALGGAPTVAGEATARVGVDPPVLPPASPPASAPPAARARGGANVARVVLGVAFGLVALGGTWALLTAGARRARPVEVTTSATREEALPPPFTVVESDPSRSAPAATDSVSPPAAAHATTRKPAGRAPPLACDPPYRLSEDGTKRIPKRECFP